MANVFLSYSHADRTAAAELARELSARGLEVWWDYNLVAGQRFRPEIRSHLGAARAAIVIWSAHSINSHFVEDEAEEARQLGKLIPVFAPDLDPALIPLGFRGYHAIPLLEIEQIATAVNRLVEANTLKPGLPLPNLVGRSKNSSSSNGSWRPARYMTLPALVTTTAVFGSAALFSGPTVFSSLAAKMPAIMIKRATSVEGVGIVLDGPARVIGQHDLITWQWMDRTTADKALRGAISGGRVAFEIEAAESPDFSVLTTRQISDEMSLPITPTPNTALYWRVRGVLAKQDSDTVPLVTDWSNVKRIEHFANVFDRIRILGEFKVAMHEGVWNNVFRFHYGRQHRGVDVVLACNVAKELTRVLERPVTARFFRVPWDRLLSSLGSDNAPEYDAVVSTITALPEREEKFKIRFSLPYYTTGFGMIYNVKGTILNPRTVAEVVPGRRVAGVTGSSSLSCTETLRRQQKNLFKIVEYPDVNQSWLEVARGDLRKVDLSVADEPTAQGLAIEYPGVLSFVKFAQGDFVAGTPRSCWTQDYAVAVPGGNETLLQIVNDTIASMQKRGLLDAAERMSKAQYEQAVRKPDDVRTNQDQKPEESDACTEVLSEFDQFVARSTISEAHK